MSSFAPRFLRYAHSACGRNARGGAGIIRARETIRNKEAILKNSIFLRALFSTTIYVCEKPHSVTPLAGPMLATSGIHRRILKRRHRIGKPIQTNKLPIIVV